ncbi:MAG: hypothetical protein ACLSWM_11380 [Barnesiella sp.]|nr:hypothetical protein [Barnesiella propionica]MCU6769411.1 hypothetical protein [Barnesiella propionica]
MRKTRVCSGRLDNIRRKCAGGAGAADEKCRINIMPASTGES